MTAKEILLRLNGVRGRDNGPWTARCPAHDDKKNSLSVTDKGEKILLHCFAGCKVEEIVAAVGITVADLFTESRKQSAKKTAKAKGVTLAQYAEAKRLPVDFLRSLKVEEIKHKELPVIRMTYRLADGSPAPRHRIREAVRVKEGDNSCWWTGKGEIVPYGIDRLAQARQLGRVTLVEGESNSHTLWYYGEPALGIPGALTWRPEWEARLEGISRVLAWIDPDKAGTKLQTKLIAGGLRDRLWFISRNGVKDVSDLHCQDPTAFQAKWAQARNTAIPAMQAIGELLDTIVSYLRRFVGLSASQARELALWVVHTYVFEAADATPYQSITSPEKESGKTRLLEVLETVVKRPWLTGRVTAAVLTRKVDQECPSLLLDESDAAFRSEKEYAEALRGILNTGYRRGGKASCCVGQGVNISYKDFSTFSPKAIAGIGRLPDTVASRAVPIRLKRAKRAEGIEKFHPRDVDDEARRLREQLQSWAAGAMDKLKTARPEHPEELTDRQQDCAEPLLAIADAAGGEWAVAARAALKEIYTGEQAADESIGVRLLADIWQIFADCERDELTSAELVEALGKIETSPWAEWNKGKPLTQNGLAKLLKPFDIKPGVIRIGDKTPRGYERSAFEDAVERYPPSQSATSAT